MRLISICLILLVSCGPSKDSLINSPIMLKLSEMRDYTLRIEESDTENCRKVELIANRGDQSAVGIQRFSQCKSDILADVEYSRFQADPLVKSNKVMVDVGPLLSKLDQAEAWCFSHAPIILSSESQTIYRDSGCILTVRRGKASLLLAVKGDSKISYHPTITDLISLAEVRVPLMNELGK